MNEQRLSARKLKQRKFLTALPILVLPFMTFFFWFLGGGTAREAQAVDGPAGLNAGVPVAVVNEQPADKLRYYELAEKESARLAELRRNDPYYERFRFEGMEEEQQAPEVAPPGDGLNPSVYPDDQEVGPEMQVLEKLEQLNAVLRQPPADAMDVTAGAPVPGRPDDPSSSPDIERLEEMMAMMHRSGEADPEMGQINSMLETILDIQHPERVQERLREMSEERKGEVLPVAATGPETSITTLDGGDAPTSAGLAVSVSADNGFFSLDDPAAAGAGPGAIAAVIHETRTLTSGSAVKLRLLSDVYINGVRIPEGHFVFGTANLNGERLEVTVDHIRSGAALFPVSLGVHDLDGLEGIHIPGAITRDAMKQSGDRSLQGLGMMTMNPSLGMQAASAGIELGKNLLSRKIRLIKVQVKAGYRVLLVDRNSQRNSQ